MAVVVVAVRNIYDFMKNVELTFEQVAMVAVAAVEVEVEAAGVMVILTMGMVVVTMGTAAGEAIDGNCLNGPFPPFSSRWSLRSMPLARLADLMLIARPILCGPRRRPCPFMCNRLLRICYAYSSP